MANVKRSQRDEQIIRRVEEVRSFLGLRQSRFAQEMGLKPQTYSNFVNKQGSKPSVRLLCGLVDRWQVNPLWLLTGEGAPMLVNDKAKG